MRMKLNIKLQTKMILGFSFNFIVIILLFCFFMVFYIFNIIEDRSIDNTQQMLAKQTQQVESYLKEINQIAKNFIVNKDIQDTLNSIENSDTVMTGSTRLTFNRIFDDIMNKILPVTSIPLSHTYIYDRQHYYKYSYNSIGSNFPLIKDNKNMMDKILDRQAIIVGNNENNRPSHSPDIPSFSIIRSIYDINSKMYGYVEVQQDYKEIRDICDIGNWGELFIVDNNGGIFYPDLLISDEDRFFIINETLPDNEGIIRNNAGTLFAYHISEDYNLTFFMKVSTKTMLAPLHLVKVITFLIIVLITFIAIFMIFLTSKQLVNPIKKLKDDMMNVRLEQLDNNIEVAYYHDEVEQLNNAFHDMLHRLKESMEKEMESSKEEAKARLAALQAQIAPHFIHNVLYIISISAQENNPQGVVDMCKSLSNMLRYVVHSPSSKVTLEDEMSYTYDYLSLQSKNYEGSLIYQIDIQEEAKGIPLPRLVIQPFVENSIMHGFKNSIPPWIISIRAYIANDNWTICIKDNGCGITQDKIEEIIRKVESDHLEFTTDKVSSDSMGNMGISNTVMRLKLVYQDQLEFSIGTNGEHGTIIKITGPVTRLQE